MLSRNRSALSAVVGVLALGSALVAPPASAVAPKAAVPAAKSGIAVTAVEVGPSESCAIVKGGQVKCWGWNWYGQLGIGKDNGTVAAVGFYPNDMGDYIGAVNLGTGRTARSVSVGLEFACAILDNGSVKCWGHNNFGQLGLGDTTNRGDGPGTIGDNLPAVDLGPGRTAKAITAGEFHACVILDNGSVKCWGDGLDGKLGIGSTVSHGDSTDDGHKMGALLPAVDLGTGRRAKSISAGQLFTCAVLDNGAVKCWGYNGSGQLGIGDRIDRGDSVGTMGDALPAVDLGKGRKARAIATGDQHACALLDNGTVKCWGSNGYGQLGQGDTVNRGDSSDSGHEMGNHLPAINLGTKRKAKAISTGDRFSCALLDNGTSKCWGFNRSGALGIGNTTQRGDTAGPGHEMGDLLPAVDVGTGHKVRSINASDADHTCVILDDHTVKCWGLGNLGQLGYGDSSSRGNNPSNMGDNLHTVNLGVQVKSISTGSMSSCAVLKDNSTECWGYNGEGQLGLGDTNHRGDNGAEMGNNLASPSLGTGRTVKSFGTGSGATHTCAILDNGSLKCWGVNSSGQLGYGDTVARGDSADSGHEMGDLLLPVNLGTKRKAKQVVGGVSHTCALLDNGSVKCWGDNTYGELGIASTVPRGDSTVGIPGNDHRMGDFLPAVDLGTHRKAKALAAGNNFTCAILDNGKVKCWGDNDRGQLGIGDTNNRGDGAGEMGNALPVVNLGAGRKAKAISAGWVHACALLDNGTVKCWGDNSSGQLGIGTIIPHGDSSAAGHEMGGLLPAVDLGTGQRAIAISVGYQFSCALLANKTVKCWGENSDAELALGTTSGAMQSIGNEPGEMGDALAPIALGTGRTVRSLSAAGWHTCVLLDDRTVKCWGYNNEGELGLGDRNNRGDAPNQMGDLLPIVAFTG